MDFIVGFPMSSRHHDAIMVIAGRVAKVAHFLLIISSYTTKIVAHIYMEQIVRLHGIPRRIISDCDPMFTSVLWTSLQHDLGA